MAISKDRFLAVFLLAYAKSPARDWVAPDTLRSVLDFEYARMLKPGGELHLQPLWDLMSRQPEFSADRVLPVLCKLKSWEGALATRFVGPSVMETLTPEQVTGYLSSCHATMEDVLALLNTRKATVSSPKHAVTQKRVAVAKEISGSVTRQYLLSAALLLVGLGFGAVLSRTPSGLDGVPTLSVSSEIPLLKAEKQGDTIYATLSGSAWLTLDKNLRHRQVTRALQNIKSLNAHHLMIQTPDLAIRVIATIPKKPGRTPTISFPEPVAPARK